MFPTLNSLFEYLFHFKLSFPVQTFGFFVGVAFWAAYQIFYSELRRYEAAGKIHSLKKLVIIGKPASLPELFINFLLGFILGFKVGGIIFQYQIFQANPRNFLLSLQGNVIAGLLTGCGFAFWIYIDQKKKALPKPVVSEHIVHPYQLTGKMVLAIGFWGVIGSKLFDVIEHLDYLKYNPVETLFNSSGYTFYGGLIFGALIFLYIGHKNGMAVIHLADIGSPGMMLAYAVGRIGCQLSGDGDWGIVNTHIKPVFLQWLPDWMWAFRFPHNVINAGLPITGCNGNYCNELIFGVYPTSFYETVICMSFFLLMWFSRKKIIIPGFMFYLYLILNGAERVLIELIRINHEYHVAGISFTQAELIGALMLIGGLYGFIYLIFTRKIQKKLLVS